MPRELDPGDLEALEVLNEEPEGGGDPPEGGEGDPKPNDADALRAELAELRQSQHEQSLRTVAMVSEMNATMKAMKTNNQQPAAQPTGEMTDAEMLDAAAKDPQYMPAVLEKIVGSRVDAKTDAMRKKLMGDLDRRAVDDRLKGIVSDNYADELTNQNSEILRSASEMKTMLNDLLDPSVRGTAMHDRLALLMGAATNPGAVSKREVSRIKADDDRREQQLERLSNFARSGGSSPLTPKKPKWTEDDDAIADALGFDASTPEARERILARREEQQIMAMKEGSIVGMFGGGE